MWNQRSAVSFIALLFLDFVVAIVDIEKHPLNNCISLSLLLSDAYKPAKPVVSDGRAGSNPAPRANLLSGLYLRQEVEKVWLCCLRASFQSESQNCLDPNPFDRSK